MTPEALPPPQVLLLSCSCEPSWLHGRAPLAQCPRHKRAIRDAQLHLAAQLAAGGGLWWGAGPFSVGEQPDGLAGSRPAHTKPSGEHRGPDGPQFTAEPMNGRALGGGRRLAAPVLSSLVRYW